MLYIYICIYIYTYITIYIYNSIPITLSIPNWDDPLAAITLNTPGVGRVQGLGAPHGLSPHQIRGLDDGAMWDDDPSR